MSGRHFRRLMVRYEEEGKKVCAIGDLASRRRGGPRRRS
jgi:hypothetical protein